MRLRRASAIVVALACLLVVGAAASASAHPLGNFTVNRYARVEVSAGMVRVLYVLDLAEVPSFQVRDVLDADPEGYAADEVERIVEGMTLEVDGTPLALRPVDQLLTRPEGQGGLLTTRLVVLFESALPAGDPDAVRDGRFRDDTGADRIGWREVLVRAPGDGEIVASSASDDDVSDELTDYPEDRLGSPLDVREVTFSFRTGDEQVEAPPLDGVGPISRRSDRFTDLLDRQDLTPTVLVGMLAVAALVGVGHALAPGHGKTVMAAYLIGTRGRPVDAVLLGVIVSAMHTASVLLLGLALHQLDERFALDRIYPALTLASGVGVLIVGVWLASTRLRTVRRARQLVGTTTGVGHHHPDEAADVGHEHRTQHEHEHSAALVPGQALGRHDQVHGEPGGHDHGGHDLDHDHGHDHGHDHDHEHGRGLGGHTHGPGGHSHELPEGVAPLSRRGLVLLATAGGIVPSPSAVIVLVSAFTLGRVGLGLALVAAFSVGLAVTLTAVGLALVLGSRAVGGHVSGRLVQVLPVVGAVALVVLGAVLTFQGVRGI
jgi:ABC-type nickel/cobalt efflux system permease component RcnA